MQLINPIFKPTHLLVALASLAMTMAQDTAPSTPPSESLDAVAIVFAVVCLIVGLIFLLAGKRLLKVIVFLSGAILFSYLTFLAASNVIDFQQASSGQKMAVYICMGILGFVGGLLAGCIWQLGLAILGGCFGAVLGSMLIRTNVIPSSAGQTAVVAGFAVGFAILTFIFHNVLYIIATSVVGGFIFMSGVDVFANTGFLGFVDNLGKSGSNLDPVTPKVWAMLASVLVLAFIGSLIQFKTR